MQMAGWERVVKGGVTDFADGAVNFKFNAARNGQEWTGPRPKT